MGRGDHGEQSQGDWGAKTTLDLDLDGGGIRVHIYKFVKLKVIVYFTVCMLYLEKNVQGREHGGRERRRTCFVLPQT